MALIKCPECGQNVSDKAKHCIHCGYPLQEPIDEFTHKWRCVNCGEMTHSLICSHCGKSSTEKQFKVNIPQDAVGDVVTGDSHMEQTPITNNKDSKGQVQIQDNKAKSLWAVLGIIAAIVIIITFVLQGGSNGSKSENSDSKVKYGMYFDYYDDNGDGWVDRMYSKDFDSWSTIPKGNLSMDEVA